MRSDVSGVAQDFLVASLGAMTSFVTAAILAAVETHWGFSLYSYTFWVVIPVGLFSLGSSLLLAITSAHGCSITDQLSSYW